MQWGLTNYSKKFLNFFFAGIIGKVLEILVGISKKIPEKLLWESLQKYLKDYEKNYLRNFYKPRTIRDFCFSDF